jgi:GNAT superfamily N-acetyltransferase
LEKDCRKGTPTVIGVVDDRGILQAAAEYLVMDFENPPYVAVHDLATAPWNIVGDDGRAAGAGSAIVEALVIESRATACDGRIELVALNTMAARFYEHMHFEKGGAHLKPEGAAKVLEDRAARRSGKK